MTFSHIAIVLQMRCYNIGIWNLLPSGLENYGESFKQFESCIFTNWMSKNIIFIRSVKGLKKFHYWNVCLFWWKWLNYICTKFSFSFDFEQFCRNKGQYLRSFLGLTEVCWKSLAMSSGLSLFLQSLDHVETETGFLEVYLIVCLFVLQLELTWFWDIINVFSFFLFIFFCEENYSASYLWKAYDLLCPEIHKITVLSNRNSLIFICNAQDISRAILFKFNVFSLKCVSNISLYTSHCFFCFVFCPFSIAVSLCRPFQIAPISKPLTDLSSF